jgi:CBS domain-containing protein
MAAKKSTPGLKNLIKRLKAIKAKDIMSKPVITTKENVLLSEIADLLIKKRISGIPVVGRDKKMLGLITANDLFLVMDMIVTGNVMEKGKIAVQNPTVKFAMSNEIQTVAKTTSLYDILKVMKFKNMHTLPVVDKGKLAGVIGRRDLYKNFYSVIKQINK